MRFLFTNILLSAVLLLGACSSQTKVEKPTFYVSVLPLKSVVEHLVGDDFQVEVLVPSGASPETFEPTPRQFIALNKAELIFNVGLISFERSLLQKIENQQKIVDLSRGIDLIEGECGHTSEEAYGVDPHVWTSPKQLMRMAENAYQALAWNYPDSVQYRSNYQRLMLRLYKLDKAVAEQVKNSQKKSFIIYHPALTYYAQDYGIQQVAIEQEGKEPSAKQLSRLIDAARRDGVKRIFCQTQFPKSTVEIIAEDVGAEVVMIDPLEEDVEANIKHITNLITE